MKRVVISLSLVFAFSAVADAQLFGCHNGSCRLGTRLQVFSRVQVAQPQASCQPYAYQAASCEPQAYVESCQPAAYNSCSPAAYESGCAEQRVGIFRRGLFPRWRARRAARLNSRGYTVGTEHVSYGGSQYTSTSYIEPSAVTVEDTGPAPDFSTADAPPPPVPSLAPLPSVEATATRPEPFSLAVL